MNITPVFNLGKAKSQNRTLVHLAPTENSYAAGNLTPTAVAVSVIGLCEPVTRGRRLRVTIPAAHRKSCHLEAAFLELALVFFGGLA